MWHRQLLCHHLLGNVVVFHHPLRFRNHPHSLILPPTPLSSSSTGTDVFGVVLPIGLPGAPVNVTVARDPSGSGTALQVSYAPPPSSGGPGTTAVPVSLYRVSWSPSRDFATAVGYLDVPCRAAAPAQVVTITTVQTTVDGAGQSWGFSGGFFSLIVTRGGVAVSTQDIPYDATPDLASESALVPQGVFCETSSTRPAGSPVLADCQQPSGSLQAALEDVLGVGAIASVTRIVRPGASAARNEYTWTVTLNASLGSSVTISEGPFALAYAGDATGQTVITGASVSPSAAVTVAVVTAGAANPAGLDAQCVSPQLVTGLVTGTPYYVRVTAYNPLGYGPGALASPAPLAPATVPGLPTAVSIAPASASQLRVQWGSPNDNGGEPVVAYRVSWGTGQDALTGALVGETGSVAVTYISDSGPYIRVISGLTPGVDYYVRVAATNVRGTGLAAASVPLADHPRALPSAPMTVATEAVSGTAIAVGWTPPIADGGDAVVQYRVDWDVESSFSSNRHMPHRGSVVVLAADDASATIVNLAAGVNYFVRVSAGNAVGFGAPTPGAPRAPAVTVPGYPSSIGVSAGQGCATLLVTFSPPLVPAAGIFCGGGGTAAPLVPTDCPAGSTAVSGVADGGSRVASWEVQYSVYADFRDVSPGAGGAGSVPVPISPAADPTLPVAVTLGPSSGANLQPGTLYFIRVAARNGQGTGPFCAREGPSCAGIALVASPLAAASSSCIA